MDLATMDDHEVALLAYECHRALARWLQPGVNENGPEEVLEYLRVYALGLSEIDRTGTAGDTTRRSMESALFNAQRRLITGDNR